MKLLPLSFFLLPRYNLIFYTSLTEEVSSWWKVNDKITVISEGEGDVVSKG